MSKFTKNSDFRGERSLIDVSKSPDNDPLMKAPRKKDGGYAATSTFGKMPPDLQDIGEQYGVPTITPFLHTDVERVRRSPVLTRGMMGREWDTRGWPPAGQHVGSGDVIEITDKDKDKDGFNLDRAQLGIVPTGKDQAHYGTQQELLSSGKITESDIQEIAEAWQGGFQGYEGASKRAMEKWNNALKEIDTGQFGALKTKFLTTFPLVYRSMSEKIKARLNEIDSIVSNIDEHTNSSGEPIEAQKRVMDGMIAELESFDSASLENSPPEVKSHYLTILASIYGNDIRAMSDNVLGFDYPVPLKDFLDGAASLMSSGSESQKPSWEDILGKTNPEITSINPEKRKLTRDTDKMKSPGVILPNGEITSRIESQSNAITSEYTFEEDTLNRILENLDGLNNIISAMENRTLETSKIESTFNKVLPHIMGLLKGMTNVYSSNFVTSKGALHGSFKVGSESKMIVYAMLQNMINAFDVWYKNTAGASPLDALRDQNSARMASAAEKRGLHKIADLLLGCL